MTPFFRRGSLFSRIFMHGLLVLLVSACVFLALAALFVFPKIDREVKRGGSWMAAPLCESLSDVEGALDGPMDMRATVYLGDGALRASSVKPSFPPLSFDELRRLRAEGSLMMAGGLIAFPCPEAAGGGYVISARPRAPVTWQLVAALLAIVILVVGLVSVPFARSIADPIERLVAVTRAFGRGDLTARADGSRHDEIGAALATAFNDMAEKLERLIRSEQEFLANVSHELRTPLARIRVVLELAEEDPHRAGELLREIGIDLADLEGLVENVMESMRLDMDVAALGGPAAAMSVSLRSTDLCAATAQAAERFRRAYPRRRIDVCADLETVPVSADPRLLRRVLDNLVENARKYSDEASTIAITLDVDDEFATVHVSDQGIGIDRDDMAHVFEPFFRGDRSRSRETGGAGLGLSLAKRIVDVHGGTIAIASEAGRGSTVSFTLKRRPDVPTGRSIITDCDIY